MSTGAGPYSGCMLYQWGDTSDGDIDYSYLCSGIGFVKEVWDDDGQSGGWERIP